MKVRTRCRPRARRGTWHLCHVRGRRHTAIDSQHHRMAAERRTERLAGPRRVRQSAVRQAAPRRRRQRPVPDVADPPAEVRRDARGRQRARRHRDGHHRDDEVHGRGCVPGPHGREGRRSLTPRNWLKALKDSATYGGSPVRRALLRRCACRHLSHRPVQEGRRHQAARKPRGVHRPGEEARREELGQGLFALVHRRPGLVRGPWLRLRLRRPDRQAVPRPVAGDARQAEGDRRSDGVQEVLRRCVEGQQVDDRDEAVAVRGLRTGSGGFDNRLVVVQLLRR